ncbi:CoA transferase [Sphaerisporangium sp. NPDC004334]
MLDLTRVIAGPVATRTLAAYGAEVLRVGAAHLPEVPGLVISTALGKVGAIAGLLRRQREGGSWHVELSLARTALWLDRLGRVDGMAVGEPEVDDLLEEMDGSFGTLTYVRAPGAIGDVRPFWTTPPPRRGEHLPAWR